MNTNKSFKNVILCLCYFSIVRKRSLFSGPCQMLLFTFWSEPALIPHFFYLPNHSSYIFLLRATFGSIQLFTFSSGSEPHSLSFLILDYLSKPHLNVCSSIFLEVLPNCPYVKSAKFISFWFNLLHIIIRRADNDPCLSKGSLQCQFLHNFLIAKIAHFSAKRRESGKLMS